jgi:citrate lyase alpha subunit
MATKGTYTDKYGNVKHTALARKDYHEKIADSGKKDGKTVSFSERVRHGVLAKKATDQIQKFMAHDTYDRKDITLGNRPLNKPKFTRSKKG